MHNNNKIFIMPETKTSDIIINNPYLMLMLEHFEINMGFQEKSVEQICKENGITLELFLTIANLFNGFNPIKISEYTSRDIQNIITYLQNSHRYYVDEKYPQIQAYIKQIYNINHHSEILMIERFFKDYFIEVTEHLDYENQVVFPYVLNVDNKLSGKECNDNISEYSVTEYKEHHNDIEEKLTDLKNLLIKYLPQNGDQQLRRKLLFCLFELEYDLNIHSQIEDSVLTPMVEKMEQLAKQDK